jgi:hypothetical protein
MQTLQTVHYHCKVLLEKYKNYMGQLNTSFKLKPGTCWVLCDNESLSPKEALDSRTFGPLPLSNIVGRAIYCSRSRSEHGFVQNSDEAMHDDSAVLAVELDVEEMTSQS